MKFVLIPFAKRRVRTSVSVRIKIVAAYSWFFTHENTFCFSCMMIFDKKFWKRFEYYFCYGPCNRYRSAITVNLAFTRLKTQGIFEIRIRLHLLALNYIYLWLAIDHIFHCLLTVFLTFPGKKCTPLGTCWAKGTISRIFQPAVTQTGSSRLAQFLNISPRRESRLCLVMLCLPAIY
jgi:hypothetical protein